MIRNVCLAVAATIFAAGAWGATERAVSAVPYYSDSTLTPEWLSPLAANDSTLHRVQPFALSDQHNNTLTEAALAGRVTVVHFFFTQCGGVCPITHTNLVRLLASFPTETQLQILSHSVTPERDSVPALQAYAEMRGITDARWHLLTGRRSDVEALAESSYFVNLANGKPYNADNLAHTETLVLVDAHGRLRGVYTGTLQLDVNRLAEDIRVLLNDAR